MLDGDWSSDVCSSDLAFAAARFEGGRVQFPADFAGRPMVIRFWADWCKYCEGEMRDIEGVFQRHKAEDWNRKRSG
jgi:thiol-disulfide isomerase/thioredoxin